MYRSENYLRKSTEVSGLRCRACFCLKRHLACSRLPAESLSPGCRRSVAKGAAPRPLQGLSAVKSNPLRAAARGAKTALLLTISRRSLFRLLPRSCRRTGIAAVAATKSNGGFTATKDRSLNPDIMSQFAGTEHWYRHQLLPGITFTAFAQNFGREMAAVR